MSLMEARQFTEICDDQGVQLGHNILVDLFRTHAGYNSCPSQVLFAVFGTADYIYSHPAAALANKKIQIDSAFADDIPATTLANLVNASLDRSPLTIEEETTSGGVCDGAEPKFIRAVKHLTTIIDGPELAMCGSQLIVQNGQPIIIRKAEGEKTGLTLAPMTHNFIPMPVGSIVSLRVKGKTRADTKPPMNAVRVVNAERVAGLTFRRLSAFALSPEERNTLFTPPKGLERYGETVEPFQAWAIEDIQEIAVGALAKLQRPRLFPKVRVASPEPAQA